jgi:hypothetical protein
MMFFAHRGVESVESAAMLILHTFCEQHPDEVMLTTLGLFPAMDPLDPAWRERILLNDVLLTMDPPEVVVRQLLRLLEAVYNMHVFRLSTQDKIPHPLHPTAAAQHSQVRSPASWCPRLIRRQSQYEVQEDQLRVPCWSCLHLIA